MPNAHTKGAISMVMINLLLVLGIAIAVTFLLFRADPEEMTPVTQTSQPDAPAAAVSSTPPAPSPPPQAAGSPEPDSQAEIDALQAQLEAETRRLEAAREQEELIEKYQQEQARLQAGAEATGFETARPAEADQLTPEATEGTANQAPASEAPSPKLITPLGFPE